uniref:Uncharacterized protein n=1 Tax=Oryza punctata TaxID=4537 RepID=A0A0E0MJD8_ORYPU
MSDRAMHTIPPPASSHGEDFAEVVVVRHGETSANALRIIQSIRTILTGVDGYRAKRGWQTASGYGELYQYVARRLAKEAKPAAVYSSDLKRAAETAQTIATACNVSNLVLDPALRERHMGDLHGLKFDDAVRSKPDAYKAFSSDDRSQEIPGGGESLDQLSERCVFRDRVIVVSHGASIEELCRHADPTSSVRKRIPNTSICVFHISGITGHWIVERFGDVAHLNEDGFLQNAFGGDGTSAEAWPAAIYSSDLKRAAGTAEITSKAWDVSRVHKTDESRSLVLTEALRERHMGYLQGLTWDDAVNKSPGVFKGFANFELKKGLDFDDRNQELPGGGESLNQLSERCISYLNKVAQNHIGERVIVVYHGAAILQLCRYTDPPNSSVRRKIPNTSLNIFRISGVTGRWILERLQPRITQLPRRRRHPNHSPNPLISPVVAASLAGVLATRSTNPTWARSLAALLPSPLSDAHLAAAVSFLPDPDLAVALLSWSQSPDTMTRSPARTPLAHPRCSASLLAPAASTPWTTRSSSLAVALLSWSQSPDHHDALPGPATPLAHSALLRLLARSRRFDAVDDTLQSMSLAGAAPTRACLGALAAAYADAGMLGKATEMCDRVREQYGSLPEVTHCNRLLKLLVEQRRWDDAHKLYDEMLGEDNGADNYSTCVLVRGLCVEGRVEEGLKLIEARWGAGCIPHVVFYNVLIDGYCRRGDMGRGLLLLGQMEAKGFLPTLVTYGSLINWLGKKGDLEKIGSLFLEMRKRGLSPNVQIYNSVIDALCKCRSATQAMVILKQMFASGCDPDIITFNTLITGLCHEGHVQEAELFLREAIRRGLNPNQFSYTPLIHGFCMRGRLMGASDLLVEMMDRGHTPDVVTFGALIHGLVVAGKVSEALIVREKMTERQVLPDVNIYNVLISGLCKKHMLPAAKNILEEMLEKNVQPDEFVYATLIDGFIRSENLGDARKIFEFMEQKGVCPDIVSCNAMIKGYCRFGMMSEAIRCMSNMRKVGCIPDEFTYTTVISGFAKEGNINGALRWLCDMIKRTCKPNVVTYSSLINGYCKTDDTDSAEGLFANMQAEALSPNVVTYTILIGSLFKKDKVLRAGLYFETMLLNHCSPNDVTLHYLVNGLTSCTPCIINSICCTTGEVHDKDALLVVFKKLVFDIGDPRNSAYNAIIFGLCRHNMLREALDFKNRMAKKGYVPNPITFLSLLYGFCSVGKSMNWRTILPNEFQREEFEIIFRYKILFDQYVTESVCCEVSRVLQQYLAECKSLQRVKQKFANS